MFNECRNDKLFINKMFDKVLLKKVRDDSEGISVSQTCILLTF